MNEKIAILLDSSCDIPEDEREELGVEIIDLPIIVDGREFIVGKDITIDEIRQHVINNDDVKTAQAPLGKLIETFENLLKEYEKVIFIPICKGLSGLLNTALARAFDYDGRLIVLDSDCVSYPTVILTRQIKALLDKGYDPLTIKGMVEKRELLTAILIPENIIYLKRGGRISAAAMALANVIKIVPVLLISGGKIGLLDKVKTGKKAYKKAFESLLEVDDYHNYYWAIMHDSNAELACELAKELEEKTNEKVVVRNFGPVILSHIGPGTIGLGRIKKII